MLIPAMLVHIAPPKDSHGLTAIARELTSPDDMPLFEAVLSAMLQPDATFQEIERTAGSRTIHRNCGTSVALPDRLAPLSDGSLTLYFRPWPVLSFFTDCNRTETTLAYYQKVCRTHPALVIYGPGIRAGSPAKIHSALLFQKLIRHPISNTLFANVAHYNEVLLFDTIEDIIRSAMGEDPVTNPGPHFDQDCRTLISDAVHSDSEIRVTSRLRLDKTFLEQLLAENIL
jgi:hypothetical protein